MSPTLRSDAMARQASQPILPMELSAFIMDLSSPCVVVDSLANTALHNRAFLATFRCDTLAKAVHSSSRASIVDFLHQHSVKTVTLQHSNGMRLKWNVAELANSDKYQIMTAQYIAHDLDPDSPSVTIDPDNVLPIPRGVASAAEPAIWEDTSVEAQQLLVYCNGFLKQVPVGISIAKLDGNVCWTNPTWRKMWQLSEFDDPNTYRLKLDREYMAMHSSRLQE